MKFSSSTGDDAGDPGATPDSANLPGLDIASMSS